MWVCNLIPCRTFLGMEISTGHTQLLEVVKRVDRVMDEFSLSTFYEVCRFYSHIYSDITQPLLSIAHVLHFFLFFFVVGSIVSLESGLVCW